MAYDVLADPLTLAQNLIRCESVTPIDDGALDILSEALRTIGFTCKRYKFGDVENLHAKIGEGAPHLVYCGHVDVVPPGDPAAWTHPPFDAQVENGILYGRGAADMKGGIAAFVAAAARYLKTHKTPKGAISLIITGDEEGVALHGVRALAPALAAAGERFDHCLGGEPTSGDKLGDVAKNGRRGSINVELHVAGKQGHVAYPSAATNPVAVLVDILSALKSRVLDAGVEGFPASNLEITTFDVGNRTENVIPAEAHARLNIRFNTAHRGEELADWIKSTAQEIAVRAGATVSFEVRISGEPFFTPLGAWTTIVADAVREITNRAPRFTTDGGTSDCRFLKDYCACVELGLPNATIHKIDEQVTLIDLQALAAIYERILTLYFERF